MQSEKQNMNNPNFIIMLWEISSFNALKLFEICNRSIFIGTRSPISLNKLPTKYSKTLIKYLKENNNTMQYFYWQRFKTLKHFAIEIEDFMD